MSGESIAFLVCGIVCILGLVGAFIGYGWRLKHPYTTADLDRSNWFTRWIKCNFNLFMWVMIAIILVCAISFFVVFAQSL